MAPTPDARPNRTSRPALRTALVAVLGVCLVLGGVVVGFAISSRSAPAPTAAQPGAVPELSAPPPPPEEVPSAVPETPPETTTFAEEFRSLTADLDVRAGLVARAVGGTETLTAGDWTVGPAWSTIKVPLSIAALRENPEVTDAIRAAITRSDNAAAEQIWQGLGDPVTAAQKVDAVLREAGDPTVVQSQRVRPEFTAFGQTQWSLDHQATFLASAACDPRDQPVLELMGQIEPSQHWGLGQLPGARFKGGWGPSPEGAYLVRQYGVIGDGSTVVAIAVEPASGSFDDGVQALTRIAQWLDERLAELPSGRCPAQ
ncbi:serine hydrolase [Mycolicibacterium hassiacum]|jgi:hypothetical protein|nr:hypothetical protein [Mycolicibacterium hassiacum]